MAAHLYADRVPLTLATRHSPTMSADFSRHHPSHLLLGNEAGDVSLVHCASEDGYQAEEVHAYQDAVFDCVWGGPDDALYAVAVADMHVYVHDAHNQRVTHCLGQHTSNVRTVRFRPNHPSILCSASRDGCLSLWDLRLCGTNSAKNRPINTVTDAHVQFGDKNGRRALGASSVTMAEFMPLEDHLLASIGQPDYAIRFWDVRYSRSRSRSAAPGFMAAIEAPLTGRRQRAFISLCVSSCGSTIYAVSSDNNIYHYLLSNFSSEPLDILSLPTFRTSGSFYIRSALSPDDRFLLCGSTEGHAYIWPTSPARRQAFRLAEHRYEVSCVAWSREGSLFVGGEDYVSRIWRWSDASLDALRYVQPEPIALDRVVARSPDPDSKRPIPVWKISRARTVDSASPLLQMVDPWPLRTFAPPPPPDRRIPLLPLANSMPDTPSVLRKRQAKLDAFFTPTKRFHLPILHADENHNPASGHADVRS